jgi:signal transduction histidine kinase/DNA-binding response OmpR family regulator/putative methionine-R-sulfoxide reductase with GAF domain
MVVIFIVEDDFYYASSLQLQLEQMGHQVAGTTDTGEAALPAVLSIRPEVILMDINLAGEMDGIETADEILAQFMVPIIFLTALGSVDLLKRVEKLRVYGYLLKPSLEWQIRSSIELALTSFAAEQKLRRNLDYQQALARCSTVLLQPVTSETEQEQVLNAVCGYLLAGTQTTRVAVLRKATDGQGKLASDVCQVGFTPRLALDKTLIPTLFASPEYTRQLSQGQDLGGLGREMFPEIINSTETISIHSFPLHLQSDWWGVLLFLDDRHDRYWADEEVLLLRTAAEMVGNTLYRWQTETELQRSRDQLEVRVHHRTVALRQSNLALQMLSQCNWAISQVQNEIDLLNEVCRIAVEVGGYRMAWIGYAQQNEQKSVEPLTSAGFERGFLEKVNITWADRPRGRGPTGSAIRSGRPQVENDVEHAEAFSPWRTVALKRRYRAAIALPLFLHGRPIGALNIYAVETNAFGFQEIELLTDLAENLSYGIQSIRNRVERARVETENQELLESLDRRLAARSQELATLFELATLSGGEQSLVDRLTPLISRVMETNYCQRTSFHLLNNDRSILELFLERELSPEACAALATIPVSDPLQDWLATLNAPVVTRDLVPYLFLPSQLRQQDFETIIICQIRRQNQPQGLLCFYRTIPDDFTLDEISFLVAVTEQINVIIENHNMKQRIADIAVTSERQRLARDLHDLVAQSLYGLTLLARSGLEAAAEGDYGQLSETLTNLESSAFQALREMRLLLFELRPLALQQEGLVKALQLRLATVEQRTGCQVNFDLDENLWFDPELQADLYMIAIEALNNILKHAQATEIKVRLANEGTDLVLEIQDDGCGFDLDTVVYGFGLQTMPERVAKIGGQYFLDATPGAGTRIRVQRKTDDKKWTH